MVRRRVVAHAREKLDAWGRAHVRAGGIVATPEELAELRSICASYAGHFSHANTWRLRRQMRARYPWLRAALVRRRFDPRIGSRPILITINPGVPS